MKNKLIGRGAFSRVYHDGKSPMVAIASTSMGKECMAEGWMPESELLPPVSFLPERDTYSMPFYASMKNRAVKPHLDADQWLIYQQLRGLQDDINETVALIHNESYFVYSETLSVIKQSSLPDDLKQFMLACFESMTNYGYSTKFEISPRSIATENGKLILVSCFSLTESPRFKDAPILCHTLEDLDLSK